MANDYAMTYGGYLKSSTARKSGRRRSCSTVWKWFAITFWSPPPLTYLQPLKRRIWPNASPRMERVFVRIHRIWDIPETIFRQVVTQATSFAEILKCFGMTLEGKDYRALKQRIAELDLDIAHISARRRVQHRQNVFTAGKQDSIGRNSGRTFVL